jgi:hypothetical protein
VGGEISYSAPSALVEKARKALDFEYSSNSLTRYDQIVEAWKHFSNGRDLDLTKDYESTASLPYIFAGAMKDVGLDDAVKEVLARDNVFAPRISAPLANIQDVMRHFHKNKPVPTKVLSLYAKQLKVTRSELLALLLSGPDFYEMPSESVSFVRGWPSSVRDTKFLGSSLQEGRTWSNPTFLISDEGKTRLYTEDGECVATANGSGLLAPIPTDNTVEQLVVCLHKNGHVILFSTTASSITRLAEFEVAVQSKAEWVNVITTPKLYIMYWGGFNHMTGEMTWSHCMGIDKTLKFVPVDPEHAEKVSTSVNVLKHGQDYKVHGNTMTMHRTHQDYEDTLRKFKPTSSVLIQGHEVMKFNDALIDVWGTPQQFVALWTSHISFWTMVTYPKLIEEIDIDDVSCEASICMLYAHSR